MAVTSSELPKPPRNNLVALTSSICLLASAVNTLLAWSVPAVAPLINEISALSIIVEVTLSPNLNLRACIST